MTNFRIIIFFTLFVLFSLSLLAETTFPTPPTTIDETHQHMLYDYKLPTWSYDKVKVGLNLVNDFSDTEKKDVDLSNHEQESSYVDINLLPAYTFYYESEEKILKISSDLDLKYRYNSRDSGDSEINTYNYDVNPWIETNYSAYISSNFSINNRFEFSYTYSYDKTRRKYDEYIIKSMKDNNTDLSYALSAGYGRIRNVNSVIASLRFNERYKAITNSSGFDEITLGKLANHFATKTSYSQYKRGEKYFYKDLPEEVILKLKQLDLGDLFYIMDYLLEGNLDRYQGYKVEIGSRIIHDNFFREEELIDSSEHINSRTETSLLSSFICGEVSHNINLYHQIGGKAEISYGKYLNDNTYLNENFYTNMSLDYLWVMYDRLSFYSQMSLVFSKDSLENDSKESKYVVWYNMFSYNLIEKISLNPLLYLYISDTDEQIILERKYKGPRLLLPEGETISYRIGISVHYMF